VVDGVEVDPTLVRDYLTKMASAGTKSERVSQGRRRGAVEDELQGERDVLDEVFFKHLKPAPSVSSLRKRLGKGSDIYVEFAGLLIDLLRGIFLFWTSNVWSSSHLATTPRTTKKVPQTSCGPAHGPAGHAERRQIALRPNG